MQAWTAQGNRRRGGLLQSDTRGAIGREPAPLDRTSVAAAATTSHNTRQIAYTYHIYTSLPCSVH